MVVQGVAGVKRWIMVNIESIQMVQSRDRERIAQTLALAFQEDPAFRYIFPCDDDRATRLQKLFRLIFDSEGRSGMRFATVDGAAASLWRRPGQAQIGLAEMVLQSVSLAAALGPHAIKALRISRAIDARFPSQPFWYLHYLGCVPDRQRRGLGDAVVRAGLARTAGHPVYLETAQPNNIVFYERFGFSVTAQWRARPDGPTFWSMMLLCS